MSSSVPELSIVLLPWAQTVTMLGALFVAWRGFLHTKDLAQESRISENSAHGAAIDRTMKELTASLDRVFYSLKEETERFRQHDIDCMKDKTTLAGQMAQNTKDIEALTRSIDNLERRLGYMARDQSIIENRKQLFGEGA